MFETFATRRIETRDATIYLAVGGEGPPLLLLHGCPQTHIMWRKIAPALAERYTVVAPDLRGYGGSSKPRGRPDHSNYAFRAMAQDQVAVMSALGFERFAAIGHDRGARVLHRMALDHPDRLETMALLDILPTTTLYEHMNQTFALEYWEWIFFVQAADMPERMISTEVDAFLVHEMGPLRSHGVIEEEAWQAYRQALDTPDKAHGCCEDYRAAASIDLTHDYADLDHKVRCPILLLWGQRNPVWQGFDMLGTWRTRAESVEGEPIAAGHYLAEEAPGATLERLLAFLGKTWPE